MFKISAVLYEVILMNMKEYEYAGVSITEANTLMLKEQCPC